MSIPLKITKLKKHCFFLNLDQKKGLCFLTYPPERGTIEYIFPGVEIFESDPWLKRGMKTIAAGEVRKCNLHFLHFFAFRFWPKVAFFAYFFAS